jgi:hypothetical protein
MEGFSTVENIKLLNEIGNLKAKQGEIYQQKGPASSDYITLSIQLNILINEYLDEKIVKLHDTNKE